LAKKHGILAKSRHLTKITVSVISVFPGLSTVPIHMLDTAPYTPDTRSRYFYMAS